MGSSCCYNQPFAVTSGTSFHLLHPSSHRPVRLLSSSLIFLHPGPDSKGNRHAKAIPDRAIIGKLGQKISLLEQTLDFGKQLLWNSDAVRWITGLVNSFESVFSQTLICDDPVTPCQDRKDTCWTLWRWGPKRNTATLLYPFSKSKRTYERKRKTLKMVVSA